MQVRPREPSTGCGALGDLVGVSYVPMRLRLYRPSPFRKKQRPETISGLFRVKVVWGLSFSGSPPPCGVGPGSAR